jgi:two-component system, NarL family, response regulator DesR
MIRILIAEGMHLMRRGLVAVLSNEGDIDVIAEVDRGDRVVPVAMSRTPDVAVIDSELPEMDGYSAAHLLAERLPGCRTLMMAERPQASDVRRVVEAGAHGLVMKETSTMASAIRTIAGGQHVVDSDLAFAALNAEKSPLTRRETEVLHLAALGTPPDEIARILHLAIGTVRNYLTHILHKVGARNRVDAVRIASEEGWLPD